MHISVKIATNNKGMVFEPYSLAIVVTGQNFTHEYVHNPTAAMKNNVIGSLEVNLSQQ